MDSKSIRTIVTFGVLAVLALTVMMMFSLNQIADTSTPQIAASVSEDLVRALAAKPPANVRLTMSRDGKGVDAPRVYKLVVRPNAAVAADEKALSRLLSRASELCADQIASTKSEVRIQCVAELPDGGTREATFARDPSFDPDAAATIHAVTAAAPGKPRR